MISFADNFSDDPISEDTNLPLGAFDDDADRLVATDQIHEMVVEQRELLKVTRDPRERCRLFAEIALVLRSLVEVLVANRSLPDIAAEYGNLARIVSDGRCVSLVTVDRVGAWHCGLWHESASYPLGAPEGSMENFPTSKRWHADVLSSHVPHFLYGLALHRLSESIAKRPVGSRAWIVIALPSDATDVLSHSVEQGTVIESDPNTLTLTVRTVSGDHPAVPDQLHKSAKAAWASARAAKVGE